MAFRKINFEKVPAVTVFKWHGKEVLDEGYVALPKRLLRTMRETLTGKKPLSDLRVLLALVDYNRPDLERPPSLRYLASIAGMEESVVEERLEDLEKRKLVRVIDWNKNAICVDYGGFVRRILRESDQQE